MAGTGESNMLLHAHDSGAHIAQTVLRMAVANLW